MAAAGVRLMAIAAALAVAGAGASDCSAGDRSAVNTLASELERLFSGRLTIESAPADVPSSCIAAFQSTETDVEARVCADDCLSWLQSVLTRDACASEEMEDALVTTTAVVAKCQARRLRLANARDYERESSTRETKPASNMRGLAAKSEHAGALEDAEGANAHKEAGRGRKLSIKGLMDAILLLTLNQEL